MDIRQFFKSMTYAGRGIAYIYRHEQNIRIQAVIAVLVIITGFLLNLARSEWVVILLLIAFVIILELVNSVFERFIDIVRPRYHAQVQVVKDMLAAMVLFAAVTAFIIGLVIFLPHVIEVLPLR